MGIVEPRIRTSGWVQTDVQTIEDANYNVSAGEAIAYCPAGSRRTRVLFTTIASIRVLRKQSSACSGVSTIGSFSLKLVFSRTGTPVIRANASMSA